MTNTPAPVLSASCTGCAACASVCPKDSITMEWNPEGFLQPVVNLDTCIHCNICTKTCPDLYAPKISSFTPSKAYAAWALDDGIRQNASSGGIFTILARHILSLGGSVYGAAWQDGLHVRHIRITDASDIRLLNSSKYLQSEIGSAHRDIKRDLKDGKQVLFSGTPCQIAGLQSYLKKRSPNLLLVDVACHGVPSKKLFDAYVKEAENLTHDQIRTINFRSKKTGWSNYSVEKDYRNSAAVNTSIYTQDDYMRGFLSDLCLNDSCYHCSYPVQPRLSDLTLADFWGVQFLHPEWDHTQGISVVLANTDQGNQLLQQCKQQLFLYEEDWQKIKHSNKGLLRTPEYPSAITRSQFLQILDQQPLSQTIEQYTHHCRSRMDIGLLGMWMTCNYGAVFTSYALYRVLEQMGHGVALLDVSYDDRQKDQETVFRKFLAQEKISIVPMSNLDEAYHLNDRFHTFMVGSDQVWNDGFMGHLFFLDFAKGEKRKIAYGPSMGQQDKPSKKYLGKNTRLLKRFDAVSVREQSLVNHLRKHFNCESTWVMDPVFLHAKTDWLKLTHHVDEQVTGSVVSYILDPSESKRQLLMDVSTQLDAPLLNMIDIQKPEVNNYELLNLPNTLKEATLYDWLSNIANCKYFVTDSYHGICFALIFNKPFICIDNPLRGSERLLSLLTLLNHQNRILPESTEKLPAHLPVEIDYQPINETMSQQVELSRQWLKEALNKTRPASLEEYNKTTEQALTRRPPSKWLRLKRRGRRFLARIYHKLTD